MQARVARQQARGLCTTLARRSSADTPRTNELDIVMLAPKLRRAVFKQAGAGATREQIRISIEHLKAQGIYGKQGEPVAISDFEPPALLGDSIEEHFRNLGELAAQPYLRMAEEFARADDSSFPQMPEAAQWRMQSGWTRYADGGASRVRVPAREDGVLVLDVEVLVPESPYPVLAAAVSQRAWYLWVSPHLAGDSAHPRHLIPLTDPDEAERPRLVIGHSVGYDRARIQDERRLRRGQLAFVDTMSLHVAGRGLCTRQRPQWQRYARARRENDAEYLRVNSDTGRIFDVSSLNSLREVARHYCGLELSKERRSVFVEGSLREVRARFAALADYCARDVDATRRVFAHVLPAFRRKCPHAASFAGALAMLEAYLPVDGAWPAYVARSERLLGELSESVARRMRELAEDARRAGGPQDDAWLRCLDWTAEAQRFTKPRLRRDGSYAKGGAPRPVARQRLAGAPKWYRDLWDAKRGRIHVTVRSRVAPYLLKLRWRGFPLYYSAAHGWTFRVPAAEARSTESDGTQPPLASLRALRFARDADDPAYEPIPARDADGVYFKVPHPDGDAARCGSPLAKAYQAAVDAGTLTSAYAAAKEAIDMNAMCSYWISARERVKGQFVVWQDNATGSAEGGEPTHRDTLDGGLTHRDSAHTDSAHRDSAHTDSAHRDSAHTDSAHTDTSDRDTSDSDPAHTDIAAPAHLNHGHPALQFLAPEDPFTRRPLDLGLPPGTGVILPQVVPMGTVTRRGVEPTWMTAANAKRSRLGSELKAMVRCPRGFRFVGADVDSEELWIAALLGDAQFSTHGATAFGWMTLQGSKAAATDLHSNTARILGIDRGRAKVFNYARIYGAGVAHATTLLRQFNPGMAEQAARARAERLYAATKGRRCHARAALGPAFWHGGSESFMFNRLEREAARDDPRTPALGCAITDALQRRAAGDAFMTSRVNWVVQSSGVDYLHLLLVAVRYLARRHHVDMRFVLSVHDEVRYMVRDQDAHRAAMCLQVANLWVRALFSSRVGIRDLPHAVAFFSAVDVDHVLRKEVDMDCVTPTNPHAVPAGQSYSIADTLRHTAGGRLDPAGPVDPAAFVLSDNHLPLNLRGLEPARPAAAAATAPPADEPDSVWLTAQMLSSSAEISALLAARDKRSAPPPPPPSSRPGGTSTRRIVARATTAQKPK